MGAEVSIGGALPLPLVSAFSPRERRGDPLSALLAGFFAVRLDRFAFARDDNKGIVRSVGESGGSRAESPLPQA